jgi:tetratricopeptide (TPR) repeat protein
MSSHGSIKPESEASSQSQQTASAQSVHIIGASMPRSGHHFLVRILQRILGAAFFYCEFYTPQSCCRKIPCRRRGEFPITFQKNHDFDLGLSTRIARVSYVVQYRDPVSAALSERELVERQYGQFVAAHLGDMEFWLAQKIHYYELFFRKWVDPPPANSISIDYDELKNDPELSIVRLLRWLGLNHEPGAVHQAIVEVASLRDEQNAFRERIVSRSRYFQQRLFEVFESILVDKLAILPDKRKLARVEYEQTPMYMAYRSVRARGRGALSDALRFAREATELSPNNPALWENLAEVFRRVMRDEAADEARQHAEFLDPELAAFRQLGRTLNHARSPENFIEEARAAADLAPRNPSFQHYVGQLLLRRGDLAGAEDAFRRAIEMSGSGGDVPWDLSITLDRAGRLEEAVEWAQQAVERAPAKAQLHHHLGNLLLRQGRLKDAEASQRKAIDLDPGLTEAHLRLSIVLSRLGATRKAVEAARTAVSLAPGRASLNHHLGIVLFNSGELGAAEAAQRKAISLDEVFSPAYHHLSLILHRTGRMEEAIEMAKMAVRLAPKSVRFLVQWGKLLFENDNADGAEKVLLQALEIDPNNLSARQQLATVHAARRARFD